MTYILSNGKGWDSGVRTMSLNNLLYKVLLCIIWILIQSDNSFIPSFFFKLNVFRFAKLSFYCQIIHHLYSEC